MTPKIAGLAEEAARLFGLDFTCVDLVEGPGGYLVYEVSAFGGFAGLWQTQRIDAAGLYAEHIVRTLTARPRYERTQHDSTHIPA
jgi:ribosomal protein S6--L-glutamate ligase